MARAAWAIRSGRRGRAVRSHRRRGASPRWSARSRALARGRPRSPRRAPCGSPGTRSQNRTPPGACIRDVCSSFMTGTAEKITITAWPFSRAAFSIPDTPAADGSRDPAGSGARGAYRIAAARGTTLACSDPMETLLHDLRYAVRTLVRTPAWTSMAVLTLAFGTGADAAVFSFVDALLFKGAPGVHPARPLVAVYTSDFSSGPWGGSSYPDYLSFKTDTTAFATLAALDDSATATLRVGDDLQRVRVARVTDEYFDALGVRTSN